ncbi:MAG: tRNA (N(6)-L-threonylcarbamoyladenosine(37)-C(2))-methylthiotransferase [Candidatus Thorarchaeota archaeon]|nr:tRNA (N(6)-L-threonylcarbamoyladenosine(37)-C(2))-methylthiotransferase [Candidatus Thorarchaeota archaeon]
MKIKYFLETYGCSLNSADSDIIAGRLQDIGAHRTTDEKKAAVIILNTCGVKEPTEDRIIYRLEELAKGETPIVIAGCLPKISLDRILRAIPTYAAILGPQSIDSMIDVLPRVLRGERGIVHLESSFESKLKWLQAPSNGVICTIPICEGCLGNCSYCAVRFARGQVKSHQPREICKTITKCVRSGHREIRITSQDLGVYGIDIQSDLISLLKQIDEIPGDHRFRLGMFNPNLVLESISALIDVMDSDHFFKFFHVPLQSGSDIILKEMKRLYSVNNWEYVVNTIRSSFSNATIATDIIVGFPGETDEDFELTMDLIRRVHPAVVNISKYGDRPDTLASKRQDKVDTSIKKKRSQLLTRLVNKIILENNESWLDWTGLVLVTDRGLRGGYLCRNYAYKPIIVHDRLALGSTVEVRIVDAKRTHLVGETISSV